MKILVLAWEFPPRIVGGMARHVAELYPELVKLGHTIHLITIEFGQAPHYEVVEGIHIHRVPVEDGYDFFNWVGNMNESMGRHGGKLLTEEGPFELIHAHDWLVGDAAIALKHLFRVPLMTTIHATESGRYSGIHNDIQRYINQKEQSLVYHAGRVIVCTEYMRLEVERSLTVPANKIDVVYNGIRSEKKQKHDFDFWSFRRRFASDHEKIVYYLGRIAYEKGIPVLLSAAPKVIWEMCGNVKFVIVGSGDTDHLKHQAWESGIWEKCYFTGFMSDEDLDKFQTVADCAVFPSLYEPFGIVALESFAAGVPVVVSDAGGFPEVVRHARTGIVTHKNEAESLANGILEILKNPSFAQWLVNNAYQDLEQRFNWAALAKQTEVSYGLILQDQQNFQS